MQSTMDLGNASQIVSQIIEPIDLTTLESSQMAQLEPNAPVLRIIGKAKLSGHRYQQFDDKLCTLRIGK